MSMRSAVYASVLLGLVCGGCTPPEQRAHSQQLSADLTAAARDSGIVMDEVYLKGLLQCQVGDSLEQFKKRVPVDYYGQFVKAELRPKTEEGTQIFQVTKGSRYSAISTTTLIRSTHQTEGGMRTNVEGDVDYVVTTPLVSDWPEESFLVSPDTPFPPDFVRQVSTDPHLTETCLAWVEFKGGLLRQATMDRAGIEKALARPLWESARQRQKARADEALSKWRTQRESK